MTTTQVAAAVGITAPALYRHFKSKQALLAAAIDSGLTRVEAVVASSPSAGWWVLLENLAAVAVERRDLWMLLQRDMRHLDVEDREPLERRFAQLVAYLRKELKAVRPDLDPRELALVVAAVLAVLSSQSTYPQQHSAADRRRVLTCAARSLSAVDLKDLDSTSETDDRPATPETGATRPGSERMRSEATTPRSEELLSTSIRLFHERGYDAVSLDDIGAAVGLTGPSIYHHYPTKADLLVSAFSRAVEWLAARRDAATPDDVDDLIRTYVDLGLRERLLFGVYVLEAVNLPDTAGRRIREGLDADVEAWSQALHRKRPGLSATERTILVQAARAVVHDVVRLGPFHDRPAIRSEVHALLAAVLDSDLTHHRGPRPGTLPEWGERGTPISRPRP